MKRKEFIKKSLQLATLSGGLLLAKSKKAASQEMTEKAPPIEDEAQKFKEAWITTLMASMDQQLDEKTRTQLMETCGRACAGRGGFRNLAESFGGNVEAFVQTVAAKMGKENIYMKDGVVHWGYPRCFCEMVAAGPQKLSETYCQCSVGWVRKVFETVARKPVKVKLLQSIKRGAASCQFLVYV